MVCDNCGHPNRKSAEFCEKCGHKLQAKPLAKPGPKPGPRMKSAASQGFSLLKLLTSALACTAVFLTVYVLANSLLKELDPAGQAAAADPMTGYIYLGSMFASLGLVTTLLAKTWKGIHFWEAALGAPAAVGLYALLEGSGNAGPALAVFSLAGVLGAQIGGALGRRSKRQAGQGTWN